MPAYIYGTTAANDQALIRHMGDVVLPIPIPWGDFLFWGVWSSGTLTKYLIERKGIGDLMDCIESSRHIEQLKRAREAGFDHIWLIIEGEYRPDPRTGMVQTIGRNGWSAITFPTPQGPRERNFAYTRIANYLIQLQSYAGVHILHSLRMTETATLITELWRVHQKPPEDHSTFQTFYTTTPPRISFSKPSLERRMFKELTHIDWKRSEELVGHFPSMAKLMEAQVKDLEAVDGVGKVIAQSIYRELRGD